MRVPLEWLKLYVDVAANAEEVAMRLTMGGLEVEGIETGDEIIERVLKTGQSRADAEQAVALGSVLDVYVTPNRGDCLSLVGVAREVAALYDLPLQMPAPPKSEPGGETATQTSVTIEEPPLCPRYAARLVRGVRVGPSPVWLQARLNAAGQRPINNIVDVTNYVMLELGQPLHAFDFDKLAGGRIVVRRARNNERLETLDGVERTLTPDMLVIADAEKAVAIAGVMGGASTEVSEATTNILFESAHFDGLSVRRTTHALGMRPPTEAAYRFERVVDPAGVRRAVDRVCELLTQIGQPEAVSGVVDVIVRPIQGRDISLRVSRAQRLLGMELASDIARNCLERLGIGVTGEGESLVAHVPPMRSDLVLEEDLIEEVGRIYGYENIPETLPSGQTTRGGDSELGLLLNRIREILTGCGLQEVVSHGLTAPFPFTAPGAAAQRVPVRNALSTDISSLRQSLLPSMLSVARYNATHGQRALALFEVGRVWNNRAGEAGGLDPEETLSVAGLLMGVWQEAGWQEGGKGVPADFYMLRGRLDTLFHGLEISGATLTPLGADAGDYPELHPGRAAKIALAPAGPTGKIGELHPLVAKSYDLRERVYVFEIPLAALQQAMPKEETRFHAIPRFPAISRDLAPRLAEAVPCSEVEAAVKAANIPLLETFRLMDVFRGGPLPEGTKSLTLNFTFRSPEGTLQDAVVTEAISAIRAQLETRCGATFVG